MRRLHRQQVNKMFCPYRWICIVWYFILNMKYMCRTCQKPCNDIVEHIKKVHGFSESYIKDQLKTNTNSYLHAFEKIKWLRKNHMDIILVEHLNRKDVKKINQNEFSISTVYESQMIIPKDWINNPFVPISIIVIGVIILLFNLI